MTFSQIKADVYRRCGFSSSPDSDVVTRIAAFINEVQQDILSEPGMEFLLNDIVTLSSVANQATYGLPVSVGKIKEPGGFRDTTNRVILTPMSLGEYREIYPDPSVVTGTPRRYVDLGYDAIDVEPSDASTLYVLSSSASDTGTAYIEGIRSGGYPFTDSVVMTGATAVASTYTDIIDVTKFYLSTAAVGTVTLREDSGTGTTLATIPIGSTYSRYRRIALAPTPSAVISYSLDIERLVTDMANATDEPVLPSRFHRLLAIGARAKEYEKQNQIQRWQVAHSEFTEELKKLKFWIYSQTVGTPNMRGTTWKRDVVGDGGSIAVSGSSSTTPLAATAGGTGFASYAIGDLLYADTATSLAKLSDVATGKVLKSGGLGVAPAYGQVALTTDVTGTLPVTNGGTGLATATQGDVLYASAANTLSKLAKDANATRYLSNTGSSNNPAWAQVDVSNGVTGDLPFANLTQGSALSVLGVTGNSTADNASIAAGSDGQVLRRSGTTVAFGAVDLTSANAVTGALTVTNGGTGLATLASTRIPYGNGTGALQSNAAFLFDGTTFTTPGAIAFPATQAPSSGVNTLDDYEEGTWTPVIGGSGGTSGQTYGTQQGAYVKVGKMVYASFNVVLTAKGTITTDVQIQGLPFTIESVANQAPPLTISYWANLAVNKVVVGGFGVTNSTAATIYGLGAAAASSVVFATADIGNTTQLIGCIVYKASA